ncbi:methyltransferase [Devosia sp. YIM 151766]|uniref:tRNA1(Val) (adenine(37)-N6)-methyltransferase n=1 Tax=Devosia sp. YIM 151766 TaxID=3017325 RepID=UPI00255D15D0|nr:methyltransferase [Devosia sp. YIM 151766]WIY53529.1 methyltransferase [Devosia sp. YIM 151766]
MGGRLTLSQPRNGFRAGLDSVLLGASVPAGTGGLLDLGAGIGAAGLVALALGRAERAVLAERDAGALALARDNIAGNGLAGRAEALSVDITAKAEERRAAGLLDNGYDAVIANPPFFAAARGTRAARADRADARHMAAGTLDLWMRCAAASAVAGGTAIFIYPAEGLAELLAAFDQRFGALNVLPLAPRPGAVASRVLVRGHKGSRAGLTLLATRCLHGATGHGFAPDFEAIFRGQAALDW